MEDLEASKVTVDSVFEDVRERLRTVYDLPGKVSTQAIYHRFGWFCLLSLCVSTFHSPTK